MKKIKIVLCLYISVGWLEDVRGNILFWQNLIINLLGFFDQCLFLGLIFQEVEDVFDEGLGFLGLGLEFSQDIVVVGF